MTNTVVVSLLSNLDRSYTNCNASIYTPSIYFEQKFVCRVDIELIFKSVRRNKEVYTRCKSKKNNRGRFRTPYVTDLKMEFFVKVVNDFKL